MIELCEATEDNPFIHGMSKQFVAALQQLFDVMDTEQSGTIHFADLANQWEEDDGDPFFPRGLIACLAKVKLPNGMLTFDRFCAGIKLCLLKNQVDINDVRMITSMTDECRSMTTSDSSITIPNGGDLNSHSQLLPPPAPSLSTSVDRPSSEPQIFAPPPPSSLSSPTPTSSSNKTAEVNNNNIIYTNNPKLTNTATCLQQIQPTEITSATKKLPLPSYEQVMAAKSKPKVPPPVLSTVSHNSNSDQSPTATASTNSLNKESHQQKQPSKTAKQFPHLSQHQLEEIKRVVNHRYLESQYGHTSGNRPSINNDNQQPLQHQQACRAKSMPHLINVSHNSPSSSFSFNTADHLNYSQQIPMNYQTHLLNHHHSHTYQRHPTTNENRKDQHINYHNSSANSIISDNNEQTPIVKTIINDENAAPKTVSRNCIMKTLQNWRDNILSKHPLPSFNDLILQTKNTGTDFHWPRSLVTKSAQTPTSNINCQKNNDISHLQASPINNDDGLNDQEFVAPVISVPNENNYIDNNDQSMAMFSGFQHSSLHRRSSIRQHRQPREPRRHTVGANGIDLYAVKRFQQLEQEKDILIGGLAEIERTKEWYLRQISVLQNRINIVSRSGGSSFIASDYNNIDAYQERINFQAVRIQTLNQHLTALRDVGQNFPIHMNLAIRPLNGLPSSIKSIGAQLSPQSLATGRIDPNQPRQLVVNPNLVNKLKEQNRLLTDEVTRKSDRITQLEREKSSLIRELFQARTYSSYYNGHFDDTFM